MSSSAAGGPPTETPDPPPATTSATAPANSPAPANLPTEAGDDLEADVSFCLLALPYSPKLRRKLISIDGRIQMFWRMIRPLEMMQS